MSVPGFDNALYLPKISSQGGLQGWGTLPVGYKGSSLYYFCKFLNSFRMKCYDLKLLAASPCTQRNHFAISGKGEKEGAS